MKIYTKKIKSYEHNLVTKHANANLNPKPTTGSGYVQVPGKNDKQ